MNNLIFDIKEFGLHDGKGLRTTVFFKGCPLSCVWCHNPEGQSFERELAVNLNKCVDCGLCKRKCSHVECEGLSRCTKICPNDCARAVGTEYSPQALVDKLMKNREFLLKGGITFSGGEPLCHGEFIRETVKLTEVKTAVETWGYVKTEDFLRTTDVIDDIYMDIKLFDKKQHIKYTGVDNALILENARALMERNRFVTFRVPLIPSVTDTDENLSQIAEFLGRFAKNIRVELIPYNMMTGAKYKSVGREYKPPFDEKQRLNKNTEVFEKNNIKIIAY